MAALSKQSYKWIIIVTFVGIILVPGIMPSAIFKTTSLVILGSICLLFEFLSLRNLDAKAVNYKSENRQTLLLILLTIILVGLNFIV